MNNPTARRNLLHWIFGNLFCMLGVAFATKSDFGLSMIGAGPYILHVALRDALPWFTQGTAEYFYEAVILLLLCLILRRFNWRFLLTFAEAFIAGMVLDGWFLLLGGNGPYETMPLRILSFFLGLFICGLGIAFFFRTTWPLQAYDLAVVQIAERYGFKQDKVKLANDIVMLGISLLLSFALTRRLTGIGIGTVITTIFNSSVIAAWGRLIDRWEKKA